ncbi:MAG: triose-phosphate isomerase [Candidatus Dormibacteraeota bacterium]|nr:triose-phosphate isomerase [Candidatus Dormibacteraeota bacterium]
MATLLAANWKMNPLNANEATRLARATLGAAQPHASRVEVVIFPPFPWLREVEAIVRGTVVGVGAQDCYWEETGAFTGAVSAGMLAGWCRWVIVGHSERRALFGETDDQVSRKARAALDAGLNVIVCVGEREDQFDAGQTDEVVSAQVHGAMSRIDPAAITSRLAFAYEPLWAIGSGHNARPHEVLPTLELVRHVVNNVGGAGAATDLRVLYGGSVNEENVTSYVGLPGCDGCLIGGAGIHSDQFATMIRRAAEGPPAPRP